MIKGQADRLEFAIRRYKQLLPRPVAHVRSAALRSLRIWLTDDVCAVIDAYVGMPRFREYASWPIQTFRPGAETTERREVDAIEQTLKRYARSLMKLATKKRVQIAIAAEFPPKRHVLSGVGKIGGGANTRGKTNVAFVEGLEPELSQAAAIAQGPQDLINLADYFEPKQEFVQDGGGTQLQRGELIVSLNPELHTIGNFIVRCMMRRLDGNVAVLSGLRHKIDVAIRKLGREYRDYEEAEEARKVLQAGLTALGKTHQAGGDNSLRDSCIILTQVYAAFQSCPDLHWLGVDLVPIRERLRFVARRWQTEDVRSRSGWRFSFPSGSTAAGLG